MTSACASVSISDDRNCRLVLVGGVAGAVLKPSHIERVAVDECGRFTGNSHVACERRTRVVLGFPNFAFVIVVEPQKKFFLGAFGLPARTIVGLNRDIRLEVLRDIVSQVRQKPGPNAECEVDVLSSACGSKIS